MEIVNGYPCLDCSDVAKAKRNIDPAASPLQPPKPTPRDAVTGVNQPLAAGAHGTQVNLLL